MDAYHNIIEKEEKIKRLQERRKKLQIMLEDERLQLAVCKCSERNVLYTHTYIRV